MDEKAKAFGITVLAVVVGVVLVELLASLVDAGTAKA
jgi:hypothetical protein